METRLFTQGDKISMERAVRTLEKKLDSALSTILGGGISFLPMVRDADGRLSAEKIEALAEDMVKALREYETPYGLPEAGEIPQNYHREGCNIVPDESAPALDADKEELCRSFAYCAICAAAIREDLGGTFGDILDIASNKAYAKDSEYYFSTGDSLELFGNLIANTLGTDILSEYYERSNPPVSWSVESDEAAHNAAQSMKNALPDPGRFLSEFKKYVKLNNAKFGGRNHITERGDMIVTYLYKKGYTVLALGDDYSTIENIVENFHSTVEAECSHRTPIAYV